MPYKLVAMHGIILKYFFSDKVVSTFFQADRKLDVTSNTWEGISHTTNPASGPAAFFPGMKLECKIMMVVVFCVAVWKESYRGWIQGCSKETVPLSKVQLWSPFRASVHIFLQFFPFKNFKVYFLKVKLKQSWGSKLKITNKLCNALSIYDFFLFFLYRKVPFSNSRHTN